MVYILSYKTYKKIVLRIMYYGTHSMILSTVSALHSLYELFRFFSVFYMWMVQMLKYRFSIL